MKANRRELPERAFDEIKRDIGISLMSLHSLPRVLLREGALGGGARSVGSICAIPSRSAAHLRGPLRLGTGSLLRVFDGASPEYVARIAHESCSRATLVSELLQLPPPPHTRKVIFAPPLDRARHAFLVEKAVELGADAIIHVCFERAEHMRRGADRRGDDAADDPDLLPDVNERAFSSAASALCAPAGQHQLRVRSSTVRAWARDATQQSGRLRAPMLGLSPVPALADALRLFAEAKPPQLSPGPRLVLVCDERLVASRDRGIGDAIRAWRGETVSAEGGSVAVVVGPEGGLTDNERNIASASALARSVYLAPAILRSETAALTALAQLNAIL